MTTDEMKRHLESVREDHLNVVQYMTFNCTRTSSTQYRYALHGYVQTDGFRLQLLAYKLKELQAARFKKIPEDRLPRRITSTVAGIDGYLTEIRNVTSTPQDVSDLSDPARQRMSRFRRSTWARPVH
ncbi:hypothetical protein BGX28_008947 [Mortierella sp. GBA30]|nr:hypothetical protein BGX28_008947 [Mortierella sp. GBA30]